MTQTMTFHWIYEEKPLSTGWTCYVRTVEKNGPAWRYKGTVRKAPKFSPDFHYVFVAGTEDGMIYEHGTLAEAKKAVESDESMGEVFKP